MEKHFFVIIGQNNAKNGAKKALIKCSGNSKRFSVIDKETEKEALSGRIQFGVKQTNVSEEGGICDFTSLDKAGSFYIRTDSGICSEEFTIKEGLYSDLLKEKTAYSSETTIKKEEINKDNIENCFLYITDAVLSEEFFGEHTIKNGKDINSKLPESIKTVKIQTDALRELINEHGVLDTGLRAGNETYYQYSAVMSYLLMSTDHMIKKKPVNIRSWQRLLTDMRRKSTKRLRWKKKKKWMISASGQPLSCISLRAREIIRKPLRATPGSHPPDSVKIRAVILEP